MQHPAAPLPEPAPAPQSDHSLDQCGRACVGGCSCCHRCGVAKCATCGERICETHGHQQLEEIPSDDWRCAVPCCAGGCGERDCLIQACE